MGAETAVPKPMFSGPARLVLAWAGLIAVGASLLRLPASARAVPLSCLEALFTSTSAVCVTGLSTINVGERLSPFGQAVLLGLIQLGGLGISTVSTLLLATAGRASIAQQYEARDALAAVRVKPMQVLWWTIGITLISEGIGAVILARQFGGEHGWWYGVFHSVSAFCNAGFSPFADNLMGYRGDAVVNFTVAGLIMVGGLGFIALRQLFLWTAGVVRRRRVPLFLHTRVVLTASVLLWIVGAVVFIVLEHDHTMADLDGRQRALAGFFQSVTPRTAGYNTLDFGMMRESTLLFTIVLMFIGAAPGSCAGGVKVTTAVAVLAALRSRIQGIPHVSLFNRTLPLGVVARAFYIVILSTLFLVIVIGALVMTEETRPMAGLRADRLTALAFEAVSAFGTVGLSTGITPNLSAGGQLLIILTMFVGRLGPLALAVAVLRVRSRPLYEYPKEEVAIG
jgi:trk system potassium uptake protein TrkH